MASKRDFKKSVDAVGAAVVDELVAAYYNIKCVDKDKIANSMELALGALAKAKNNSNIFFDRGAGAFADKKEYAKAKKAFFKALFLKINTEFSEELNEAMKALNEALPAEVKASNKALANA